MGLFLGSDGPRATGGCKWRCLEGKPGSNTHQREKERRNGKLCLRLRYRGIPRRVRVSLDEAGRVGGGPIQEEAQWLLKALFIMLVSVMGLVSTYRLPLLSSALRACNWPPFGNMAQLIGHVNPCCLATAETLITWVIRKLFSLGGRGQSHP